MPDERYPGERRGLRLFLEELLPAVERTAREAGPSLLRQAIVRALRTGDLLHLRHARQLFNHLPRDRRQALSTAMLRPKAPRPVPTRDQLLDELSRREPRPVVCFEAKLPSAAATEGSPPVRVELRHELLGASPEPVRVSIEPGTLPSVAADALRRMATMLEADRRLLSARFWEQEATAGGVAGDEQRDAR